MLDLRNVLSGLVDELKEGESFYNDYQPHYDFYSDYTLDELESYGSDKVHEFCDGFVDIYTGDLRYWLEEEMDADDYMERVVWEGLVNMSDYSFTNHIMSAQFEYYYDKFYEDNEMIETLSLTLILEQLIKDGITELDMTEEQLYEYATSDIDLFYVKYEDLKEDIEGE